MKKNVFKTLGLSFLIASSTLSPTVFAADKKSETEKIEVTPTTDSVTPQELAAIYVISETCPKLIGKDLKFNKAYENLVKAYLNNDPNAVEVLNKRAKSKDFQAALKEARADAKAASEEDNRQICDDVRNYYSK
ncbi:hypothetical protein HWI77_10940 [Acinetobacter venetianus]|jgi:hypothetical protein|uniref:DUF7944 domain-containing protein n=3 Tax=Gammaproteobacteria TaxID=1236 RepID=N8ZYA9_ACIVR|nr:MULTISPECIES: hypothetical protein [Acinetobacter]MDA0697151.1 hypothetical protein [Pseudomonadota bacterium]ENV36485.1 hypothetical protein F959_02430 [Acinetobacter venetianus RAG-1 = CIP 110063]ERS04222.1 hypothetical protein Q674_00120 [Acinetobacter sp. COS3]KXO76923.1 hypothetical protein AYL20_09150 [Acinetobacter venetianus]KXO85650.1 hypothetical protein AYK86_05495 [Acinetobacter venetianus]|tara:strand:+ start:341 stop:742 length:402 start_codon:yes stop_codon:yes gene_type:complete